MIDSTKNLLDQKAWEIVYVVRVRTAFWRENPVL